MVAGTSAVIIRNNLLVGVACLAYEPLGLLPFHYSRTRDNESLSFATTDCNPSIDFKYY